MKISQGDTIIVTTGKDKGKKGTVMRVLKNENRVVVSGINMVTKHIKKTAETEGKKVRFEHSIHASNVMILDPKSGKPSRVGYVVDSMTGKKARIAKKSGVTLERVRVTVDDIKKDETGETQQKTPKFAFWKKGQSSSAEKTTKADSGPAVAKITHTRSAGRGS